MTPAMEAERLRAACRTAVAELLAERTPAGHWVGELSSSALAVAVALVALRLADRAARRNDHAERIVRGTAWLLARQLPDGGWGDTDKSLGNISTTMLALSALTLLDAGNDGPRQRAQAFVDRGGGIAGIRRRYGKDQTFSVPILACAALCGVVPWKEVPRLPFELAALPPRFYKTVRLPVVSYALPALIAIGQVRHHFGPPRNPLTRVLRNWCRAITLRRLEGLQPSNGGFLEATPLTAFVAMSLAGMGRPDHPVARKGAEFLAASQRPDGSWPIDTNLATWVTTLAVNALEDDLPPEGRTPIRDWLLGQQYRTVHPFTQADPGGWAWTDLPGGVPDADDTAGAVLALKALDGGAKKSSLPPLRGEGQGGGQALAHADAVSAPVLVVASLDSINRAAASGLEWLRHLQNRDGGTPTFCRGWGTLPFDRSSCDIAAHMLRAAQVGRCLGNGSLPPFRGAGQGGGRAIGNAAAAFARAHRFLLGQQRTDGAWLPLWFGNQHCGPEENAIYGTAKVLECLVGETAPMLAAAACRGVRYLLSQQQADGSWGGTAPEHASVEETALATNALLLACAIDGAARPAAERGVAWLVERVESGRWREPAPIGFYFAKLWYYEKLYPLIWTVAALRRAVRRIDAE